jgi:hypothetical protein
MSVQAGAIQYICVTTRTSMFSTRAQLMRRSGSRLGSLVSLSSVRVMRPRRVLNTCVATEAADSRTRVTQLAPGVLTSHSGLK